MFYNAVLKVSFLVFNHLAEEERAGCFTMVACGCLYSVSFPPDAAVGLQYVILAFPANILTLQ